LLAASGFVVSLTKIYSAISQPRPALKPYHKFVYGSNTVFVWFQHQVWLADGIVLWQHNTMFNRRKEGCIGGLFSPLPSTFLVPPWQKNIIRMHCLNLVLQRVRHRRHIGCCLWVVAKLSVQWVDDALYTK
jgi:hypothetical protein